MDESPRSKILKRDVESREIYLNPIVAVDGVNGVSYIQ